MSVDSEGMVHTVKKLVFLFAFVMVVFSFACADTVYIPEEVSFPEMLDDPQMQSLIDQGIATGKAQTGTFEGLVRISLKFDQYEIRAYYNDSTGKISRKNQITLHGELPDEKKTFINAYYGKDQKMTSATVARNYTEDDRKIRMEDHYSSDGEYYFGRFITTPSRDYYYYFSSKLMWLQRGQLSFKFDLPEKEWVLYVAEDTELVSMEKNPDFEYNHALADVVIGGKLDLSELRISEDGSAAVFVPDLKKAVTESSAGNKTAAAEQSEQNLAELPDSGMAAENTATEIQSAALPGETRTGGEYKNIRISVNGDKVILLDENDEQQKSYVADGVIYVPIESFIRAVGGNTKYSAFDNQLAIELPDSEEKTSKAAADIEIKWGDVILTNTDASKEEEPVPEPVVDANGNRVVETADGKLVIKGYSFSPKGFKGYTNDHKYDNYSIFTVHATLTIKGTETKNSWSTFMTQAYQNGIDARRHTDFSKKVSITTQLMPDKPVDIDYDFLVESPTDPITFMVKTWGKPLTLLQEEIEIKGNKATPK